MQNIKWRNCTSNEKYNIVTGRKSLGAFWRNTKRRLNMVDGSIMAAKNKS
jgi:hypothetical protein